MTIPRSDHLLEQAERLIDVGGRGSTRQTDMRRAMSTAYYALFHFLLTRVADEFAGRVRRGSPRYELVYRSVDHRTLRTVCEEVQRSIASKRYASTAPASGWHPDLRAFALVLLDLQFRRHEADYNPSRRFGRLDVASAIVDAKSAISAFGRVPASDRDLFLTLLLCPPR